MLGIRSTAAARAAARWLRHPGGGGSFGYRRTLASHHSVQSLLASNTTREKDREFICSSIKLYSTRSVSNSSTPRDAAASNCSSCVENGEAGAEAVVPEAYVAMRNAAMDDAYYAIELALDSVVKIFTVASSPSYSLPWQNKSQRESMGSGLHLFRFYIPFISLFVNEIH